MLNMSLFLNTLQNTDYGNSSWIILIFVPILTNLIAFNYRIISRRFLQFHETMNMSQPLFWSLE